MELFRAYLLEELPHENAEAVELGYFQDRTFLYRVQVAETALIEDYLEGRLAGPRKARFEARYLTLPYLRAQVEKARQAFRKPPALTAMSRSRMSFRANLVRSH